MSRTYVRALALVGCVAVVTFIAARPTVAQGVLKPVMALIVNDSSNPVPVTLQGTNAAVPVTVPAGQSLPVTVQGSVSVNPAGAWTGTPYVESHVNINRAANGFESCEQVFSAAAGTAVIVKTVSVRYSVPAGTFGSARLLVTPFGGGSVVGVPLPTPRVAPVSQVAGLYDGYAGSLDMGGLPVVEAQYCQSGVDAAGTLAVIGFTVTP